MSVLDIAAEKIAVSFRDVDIVFGSNPKAALPLIDEHKTRPDIQAETGQILGVAGATLDVFAGELLVLMGLSGSGKSTLLRAINGLTPITRGEIELGFSRDGEAFADRRPISRFRSDDWRRYRRREAAMVFQQFALLPWRTVADNVAFGLELSGVDPATRAERVEEQLRLVGLDGWGERRVSELSGGMQQRVGLARAFATQAPLLLMDEPFSALDPLIREKLQDDLLDLKQRLNRTIVFVSHDLDEALKLGNRIAIMEGGRIVQVGTPRQIVLEPANGYVREFVGSVDRASVLTARDVMVREANPGARPRPRETIRLGERKLRHAVFAVAPPSTPLRAAMKAIDRTGLPLLVEEKIGGDTRIVGTVCAEDVLRALTA